MFSVYTASSANNSLVSFFMILIFFIYFSCLTLLARTSSTVMNRSGIGHPSVGAGLRVKAFGVSPLGMTFSVGFSEALR